MFVSQCQGDRKCNCLRKMEGHKTGDNIINFLKDVVDTKDMCFEPVTRRIHPCTGM